MEIPKKLFAGYIPVIDNGYLQAIDRHAAAGAEIGVFAMDIAREFAPYTRKEIRLLEPERVEFFLKSMGANAHVLALHDIFDRLADSNEQITLIDDDISRGVYGVAPHIGADVTFESAFLRWNRQNIAANKDIQTGGSVSSNELDAIFHQLYQEADKSSDWWRYVAAAIVNADGELVTMQHNQGMPHEYIASLESDPRILSNRGSDIELSLFLHAEAGCIAHAAKEGVSLNGSSIYVTTFPCPNCAKIIAASGVKKVYFTEGYAMLDGQRVLEKNDIEIIRVATPEQPQTPTDRLMPYPEK